MKKGAGGGRRETRMADKRKRTKKNGTEDTRASRADAMIDPPKRDPAEERKAAGAAAPPAKKRAPRKKAAAQRVTEQQVSIEPSLEEPAVARTSTDLATSEVDRLLAGESSNPHATLGAHPASLLGESGVMIRALIPS